MRLIANASDPEEHAYNMYQLALIVAYVRTDTKIEISEWYGDPYVRTIKMELGEELNETVLNSILPFRVVHEPVECHPNQAFATFDSCPGDFGCPGDYEEKSRDGDWNNTVPAYEDCYPDPWAGDYASIARGEL